jgi:hypothetical protein
MKVIFSILILMISIQGISQSIWTNPITGTNPNTANPYTTGQTVDANISVSGIGRGIGAIGTNANDRYNANSWFTAAIDPTAYFEFTLTPSATCEIDLTSFVYIGQASASGPTSFAFRSSLDSYSANIGTPSVGGTTISLSGAIYQNLTSPITFRFYAWGASSDAGTFSINNFTFNGSTSCGSPTNTIENLNVLGSPFTVDCTTGVNSTVSFTTTGTFNAGNTFTAEFSDASGSFAAPTIIGSGSTSPISITIPATTPTGSGYLIRIVSSNPSITSTLSSSITITLSGGPCILVPPHLTSVIINSCQDGTCSEGHNEIVFGNTGDYSVNVTSANFDLFYGTAATVLTDNYTESLATNATTTSLLNTQAGCTGTFVEGTNATIPTNSSFIVVRNTLCSDALDWSSLCGLGPIYVIYTTDATWQTSGNFSNSAAGMRYFNTVITTTTGNVFDIDYSFNSDNLTLHADGDYVTFDNDGGLATAYGNSGCTVDPIVLSTELINFSGEFHPVATNLYWSTSDEKNNSHFTIFHSADGKDFTDIGSVSGAGNSSFLINYRFTHSFPHPGINYYKLHSTDYDGKTYYKGIVAIEATFNFSYFNSQTATIELAYNSDISIYAMDGKLIEEKNDTKSIHFDRSGMFIILDRRIGISERLFIP